MNDREFNITARRLEKAFGEHVLPRPSPEFIAEQERRESLANASFFLQVSHGIGLVMLFVIFLITTVVAYKTGDPEVTRCALFAFGTISAFFAYLLSPLNQTLSPSEIPMDTYVFRSTLGRSEP